MQATFLFWTLAGTMSAGLVIGLLRCLKRDGQPRPAARDWLVVLGPVALGSFVYLLQGWPGAPDLPQAPRLEAMEYRLSLAPELVDETASLALLQRAAKLRPEDAEPHIFIGRMMLDQQRYPEAGHAYLAALRRDPKACAAMSGLGKAILGAQGAPTPSAIYALTAAQNCFPDNAEERVGIDQMLAAFASQ